jgi:hypothetical protein
MRLLPSRPPCEVCAEPDPGPHTQVVVRRRGTKIVQHAGRHSRRGRVTAGYIEALMRHSGTPGWS